MSDTGLKPKTKLYTTTIKAIDPMDGQLKEWRGPRISATSMQAAELYVEHNGMGYLDVDGEFIEEHS